MIKLATLFSGIGAVEHALAKQKISYNIIFACDNGEREILKSEEEVNLAIKKMNSNEKENYIRELYIETKKENYVEKSYKQNYKIKDSKFYQDIRFLDGTLYKNKVDLLVGGSPCQSFSIIGKRGGFEDTRGTLFFDYARIIKETKPKVFIFENVKGMLSHDMGKTWEITKQVLEELNYDLFIPNEQVLNSKDYGIPQNRTRIFVIGFLKELNLKNKFKFPEGKELTTTLFDYLEDETDAKYYLGKKGFEFVTNPKYKNRARINQTIIMTQKANQQFNWNGDFIFEELNSIKHNSKILERAYVGQYEGKTGIIRKLTPRECLRLMGFSDNFKICVPDTQIYRQAGNSIVVNILEEIIKEIIKTGVFDE